MWFPPKFPTRNLIALKYIFYFLSLAGLFSLIPQKNSSYCIYTYEIIYNCYFIIAISCTTMVTIFTGIDLFEHLKDVDVLADHGVIFAALIVILIKQYSLIRHKRIIEIWVAKVQRRYIMANKMQKIRFKENDKETFYYVKVFFCIWILITASYLLPLYFGRPDKFELPTIDSVFFRVDSLSKYFFLYAWNTAALSLAIFGVFAVDLFMVAIYSHATSRLHALGDALENIGRANFPCKKHTVMTSCEFCRSAARQLLKKSVSEHCDIVKLVGELNHVFYWTLLVQSVFVAIIVAACGFNGFVSILHGNIPSLVKSVMYIFGVICENWFYCDFGDRLKCASLNVAKSLWKSHWYKLPEEDRKSVLLIMRASENPLYMAAGKIFRMDLEHLGFILSSAYSYFTVLRNFA